LELPYTIFPFPLVSSCALRPSICLCNINIGVLRRQYCLKNNRSINSNCKKYETEDIDINVAKTYCRFKSKLRPSISLCSIGAFRFGPRRVEVTGDWRRLHNEELNDLYSSPNVLRVIKSRRMRWAGHVARMGEERGVDRVLVGKPEGKRPMGRPRRR